MPFAAIAILVACNSSSDTSAESADTATTATSGDTTSAAATKDITQDPNYSSYVGIQMGRKEISTSFKCKA